MGRQIRMAIGAVVVMALALAACGDDTGSSDAASAASEGSDAGSESSGSGGGSESLSLDEPVKIVALVEVKGESPAAVDTYWQGIQMAVEEVNDAGGFGGHEVELERVAAPLDPQGATTAVLRAQEMDPDVLVGIPSGGIAAAVGKTVADGGVPLVSISTHPAEMGQGKDLTFFSRIAGGPEGASAAVEYATQELGAENIGLLYVDVPFGHQARDAIEAKAEELGLDLTASRGYAFDAQDLTEQVLAVEGSDAVVNWAYPNPLALQLRQFQQNDLDIPTVDSQSAPIAVAQGLVEGEATEQLHAVVDCNPQADATEWSAAFEERFSARAEQNAAVSYDSVRFALAAIEEAGTTAPDAVTEALGTVEMTDGVCSPSYQADGENTLMHHLVTMSFAGGSAETVKEYSL